MYTYLSTKRQSRCFLAPVRSSPVRQPVAAGPVTVVAVSPESDASMSAVVAAVLEYVFAVAVAEVSASPTDQEYWSLRSCVRRHPGLSKKRKC